MKIKMILCVLSGMCLILSGCAKDITDSRKEHFATGLPTEKTESVTEEYSVNALTLQNVYLEDNDHDGVITMRDKCLMSHEGNEIDQYGCEQSLDKIKTIAISMQFDTDSSIVKDEYYEKLSKIAELHKSSNEYILLIEGYADNTGNNKHNIALSNDRAKAVAKILIKTLGVKKKDILLGSFGSEKNIADNSTEDGRQQNRRVVVHIKSHKKIFKKQWNVWIMESDDKKREVKEYYRHSF